MQSAVKAMISLAKVTPAKNMNIDDRLGPHVIVLDTIVRFMQDHALDLSGREQLLQSNVMRSFKPKAEAVFEWCKPAGLVVQQRALLRVGVELLYENLVDMGWAISTRTMASHVHRIPSCLNKEFPGYAHAGYLHMIVRGQGT